jgi:cell division protein ZapA
MGNVGMDTRPAEAAPQDVMAHVTVTIAGRQYRMACEKGQEDHLLELAADLDGRLAKLHENFGEIGDQRLLVMVALMVADEFSEMRHKMRGLEEEIEKLQDTRLAAADHAHATQAAVVAALNAAAERIEHVTKSLNQTLGTSVAIG